MGRPSHKPTPDGRKKVAQWASEGKLRRWIAKQVGICEKTLREHYGDELSAGDAEDEQKLEADVRGIARDPNHPKQLTALIFLLNTRYGHAKTEKTELDAKVEGSLPVTVIIEGTTKKT